jgi:transposase-like protein
MEDGRCKLGLAGRLELVRLIESGSTLRAAAVALGFAPATPHRWWHRWEQVIDARAAVAVVLAEDDGSRDHAMLGRHMV